MKIPETPNKETAQIRLISRWRWIILLLGIGIVFVAETTEHAALTPELDFIHQNAVNRHNTTLP